VGDLQYFCKAWGSGEFHEIRGGSGENGREVTPGEGFSKRRRIVDHLFGKVAEYLGMGYLFHGMSEYGFPSMISPHYHTKFSIKENYFEF